jgi:hypothetical protein
MSRNAMDEEGDLLILLLNATPENPVDKKLLSSYAERTFCKQTNSIRFYAWLSFADIYKNGLSEFEKKCSSLLNDYKYYISILKLENWEKRRLSNRINDTNLGLEDNRLMVLIHSDISRMSRQLIFFSQQENSQKEEGKEGKAVNLATNCMEQHMRRIERILYIYAMFNKETAYMQGFNELIIPFYFVMTRSIEHLKGDYDLAECLSFNLFIWLMMNGGFVDVYLTSNKPVLMDFLNSFEELMKKHVPNSYKIINSLNIPPHMYAFRWFSLLFAQEYELPSLISIWDVILSKYGNMSTYIKYVALGHLKAVEGMLDRSSSSSTLGVLQKMYINNNPESVITFANCLYRQDYDEHL